nr:MAG TPA: hypothetical protein [Caudoviricetes sp.]
MTAPPYNTTAARRDSPAGLSAPLSASPPALLPLRARMRARVIITPAVDYIIF